MGAYSPIASMSRRMVLGDTCNSWARARTVDCLRAHNMCRIAFLRTAVFNALTSLSSYDRLSCSERIKKTGKQTVCRHVLLTIYLPGSSRCCAGYNAIGVFFQRKANVDREYRPLYGMLPYRHLAILYIFMMVFIPFEPVAAAFLHLPGYPYSEASSDNRFR